ncbi:MAG TPA: glycerophosphodiester phosphodiesterase family protein [Chthoniobacterales bacterium]|nr:glycerophosphodiester phosphodiesterase family protein [Chthoniobacterales bacterium]
MRSATVFGDLNCPASAQTSKFLLIAHRGGVVEGRFPDNSMAALQAALDRGYPALEVDVRESRDGHAVMRHDRDLWAYYRDERNVDELTWAELRCLRTCGGQHRLLRFEEVVMTCKNKADLMVDLKPPHSRVFPALVEMILRREGMLERTYIIGTPAARRHFAGKAFVGYSYAKLLVRLGTERHARRRYFVFDEGRRLTDRRLRVATALQIKIIPSVNVFHYEENPVIARKPAVERAALVRAAARAEIERLKARGLCEFQIDPEFDRWF